jgi:hypothetical protein
VRQHGALVGLSCSDLRLRETLSSCRLIPGASASYGNLSVASNLNGVLCAPAVDPAAAWLHNFYQQDLPLFQQHLPPAWHARFTQWLAAQRSATPACGP